MPSIQIPNVKRMSSMPNGKPEKRTDLKKMDLIAWGSHIPISNQFPLGTIGDVTTSAVTGEDTGRRVPWHKRLLIMSHCPARHLVGESLYPETMIKS